MPAKYVALRDKMISQGKPVAKAKQSAAKIFNSQRKPGQAPVTKSYDKGHPFKKKEPQGSPITQFRMPGRE